MLQNPQNSLTTASSMIPAVVQVGNSNPNGPSLDLLLGDPRTQRIQWHLTDRLEIASVKGDFSAYGITSLNTENSSDLGSIRQQILALLGESQTLELFNKFRKAVKQKQNLPAVEIQIGSGNSPYWVEQVTTIQEDTNGNIGIFSFWQDKTKQKLAESTTAILSQVIESIPSWIFLKNTDHSYELVNSSYASVYGVAPEECVGKNSVELGVPEELAKGNPEKGIRGFWNDDKEVFDSGKTKDILCEPIVINGEQRFLQTRKTPIKDSQTGRDLLVGFCHDITYLKEIEKQIGIELRHNKTLNEVDQIIRSKYDIFKSLESLCALLTDVIDCQEFQIQVHSLGQTWAAGKTTACEYLHAIPAKFDCIEMGVLTAFHDSPEGLSEPDQTLLSAVSDQLAVAFHRQELMSKINYQAHHDSLTDLPNRNNILPLIESAINDAQQNNGSCAVIVMDLDGFKLVNDTLGHQVGDQLLIAVANRLDKIALNCEFPARLGGDEFAILLSDIGSQQNAVQRAEVILEALQDPFEVCGKELFVGASLGVSHYPEDSVDGSSMLQHADWAMYLAKSKGRNNCEPFTIEIEQKTQHRANLENDLRKAIQDGGELSMVFQPKLDVASMEVTSVEALVRWDHPIYGLVSPTEFIPIAEETGLIMQLGAWIMHQSCSTIAQWNRKLNRKIQLSLNITPPELEHRGLIKMVTNTLEETGLEPKYLDLELTETFVMKRIDEVSQRLQQLRQLGIKISIDDFGTGYSCMSYLHRLPVDCLKIDRSFIELLDSDQEDKQRMAITQTIVSLAKSMNLETVAEGIESINQLQHIQKMGVDKAQGFLFSHPLPEAQAFAFISEKNNESNTR